MAARISFDLARTGGPVKPINAVNNGPIRSRSDQSNGNFDLYSALDISYARTHDASFCSAYGGEHTVDITAVFPNFDADENDPASYDFHYTDEYIDTIQSAGTKVFFRLGHKIEHGTKKYGTLPPKDFAKWARVCEHLIRHTTEGWADGHHWDIEYWEIWNEPDLDPDDSPNKRCWGGTKAQFFDLFEIAAKHLKACFPDKKIGGPAIAYNLAWAEDFLAEMQRRGTPIDFFSWHRYTTDPHSFAAMAEKVRALLDRFGFGHAESILNEWNYVRGWGGADWIYSLRQMEGLKGASFVAATMAVAQAAPIDMLMYYDARPTGMNGIFDETILCDTRKGYEVYRTARLLRQAGTSLPVECSSPDVYGLAATDGRAVRMLLTYYREQDGSPDEPVTIAFETPRPVTVTLCRTDAALDSGRVFAGSFAAGRVEFTLSLKQFDIYDVEIAPLG